MNYINTVTLDYPLTKQQVMEAFPDVSFAQPFSAPEGFAEVSPTPEPTFNPITHSLEEGVPEFVEGAWRQTWALVMRGLEEVQSLLIGSVEQAVQQLLDAKAQERGYDGILSACTYTASAVPRFAAEAQLCAAWRDAAWATCYQIMADVQSGSRPLPTVQEVLDEMPAMEWPQ